METQLPVLDQGFVRLDGITISLSTLEDLIALDSSYSEEDDDRMIAETNDLSVANAARASFAKRSDRLGDRENRLIKRLATERHGAPFEHNLFRWHVKAPIFVAREWFRHRIGSFSEWSGRYSKMLPDFYVPDLNDVRTQVGDSMSYTFEPVAEAAAEDFLHELEDVNWLAWNSYEHALSRGIAKEVARLSLPLNLYTEFYWSVNARSLMNFLSLRNAPTAMLEIRRYAEAVEHIWSCFMPVTHDAFTDGRVAP